MPPSEPHRRGGRRAGVRNWTDEEREALVLYLEEVVDEYVAAGADALSLAKRRAFVELLKPLEDEIAQRVGRPAVLADAAVAKLRDVAVSDWLAEDRAEWKNRATVLWRRVCGDVPMPAPAGGTHHMSTRPRRSAASASEGDKGAVEGGLDVSDDEAGPVEAEEEDEDAFTSMPEDVPAAEVEKPLEKKRKARTVKPKAVEPAPTAAKKPGPRAGQKRSIPEPEDSPPPEPKKKQAKASAPAAAPTPSPAAKRTSSLVGSEPPAMPEMTEMLARLGAESAAVTASRLVNESLQARLRAQAEVHQRDQVLESYADRVELCVQRVYDECVTCLEEPAGIMDGHAVAKRLRGITMGVLQELKVLRMSVRGWAQSGDRPAAE